MLDEQGKVQAQATQTRQQATKNMKSLNAWWKWVKTRVNDHSCKHQVQDSGNGKACMCVKWVSAMMTIRNVARDLKGGLTPKQLRMCRRLLDAMWDIKATKLMWGMSFAMSSWWVFIKSRLLRACHKSRESDSCWEVSKMIFSCNLQLLKTTP